jgi:hypothetical protein
VELRGETGSCPVTVAAIAGEGDDELVNDDHGRPERASSRT